jgi:DNA invertase Pin-like site-specific DNA recombinase
MNKRVVGYVRVSKVGDRQKKEGSFLSPDLQREEIGRVAAREGLEVVEVIEELDASGGDASRPGWNRALAMVERGEVGGVVAWNYARMSRSTVDFLSAWDRVRAAGGRLYSATESTDDSPSGRMLRTILLAVAENERDRARAGFDAAVRSAVGRGVYVASRVPMGYRRGPDRRLVPDPETSPVVVGLFERRAAGWSWVRLARWAREQGHPLTEGGVRGIVGNEAYLGHTRYGGLVREDTHEAVVPRGLWRRCQAKRRPSARSGRLTERYLLQGIAACGGCGGALYLGGGNKRHPYYYCRRDSCPDRAYAQAQALDDHVLHAVEERTDASDPSYWARVPGAADVRDLEAALDAAREDLDGYLADTALRRTLGADRYNETAARYVAKVNGAEEALAEARGSGFELPGRLWNTEWGWAERKEWVDRIVRSVVVSRGTEPLSRRAEVELR